MNRRERLLGCLRGDKIDRFPDFEFGVWEQTVTRWQAEGLPASYGGVWGVLNDYFHTDEEAMPESLEVQVGLLPRFETKVLEEKGDHVILQDDDGAICERMKSDKGASIPKYLRYAIETRSDWEKIRDERLNPDDPRRCPEGTELDRLCGLTRTQDAPYTIGAGSLYGWLRNWMGVENLSIAFCEEPDWIEEMMEHLTRLTLAVYAKIAGKAKVDQAWWWEDMCFKTGSLLSPTLFAKTMVPRYRRVTDFLRNELGCAFNTLDCDGNIHQLVGLWREGGINVMFPIESAWTDAFRIDAEFGIKAPMRGAFDKRALIEGPAAIDREFERLMPLIRRGAFIPHTDHLVPPDVSFSNYRYYRQRKCQILGKEYREG
jgi:hypothetical protein